MVIWLCGLSGSGQATLGRPLSSHAWAALDEPTDTDFVLRHMSAAETTRWF